MSTHSGWSSGTGAAGVAGSLIYAGLRTFLSARTTLLAQVFFPALLFISYMFILRRPQDPVQSHDDSTELKNLSTDEDEDTASLLQNQAHSTKKFLI